MKNIIAGCMLLTLVALQTATAGDIGVFASYSDHEDGDAVLGGGVLFLPSSLPMEFRGTFYERSNVYGLQASPLDIGVAFGLTRYESVRFSAVGGGSYYLVDGKGYSPDNELGWYIGGRAEFSVDENYALFGEALYRGVKLDYANFSGITFNLGILF